MDAAPRREPEAETVMPVTASPQPSPAPQEPDLPTFRFAGSAGSIGSVGSQVVPEAAPPPVETTPVDLGSVTDRLSRPILDRALGLLPDPAVPTFPPPRDPTIPLLLVVALAAYALVVGRGDRRDPKLARSAVDPGSRGLGFK